MIDKINALFVSLDQQTTAFCHTTGLYCKSGCGACCEHPAIETTIAEMLPLAQWAVDHKRVDDILNIIVQQKNFNHCVFYEPDLQHAHQGRCKIYDHRPGLCRLFGFAVQKNSTGQRRLSTCKVIKETLPAQVKHTDVLLKQNMPAPIISEHSMNVLILDPNLGKTLMPIAQAAQKAIEYIALKQNYQDNK